MSDIFDEMFLSAGYPHSSMIKGVEKVPHTVWVGRKQEGSVTLPVTDKQHNSFSVASGQIIISGYNNASK